MITHLTHGIFTALDPINMLAIIAGTIIGVVVGALPGLTASMGIALMTPITFGMEPITGLLLVIALYIAALYGGSISAIAFSAPGTPAAAATALDGYPLAQKGYPGKALGMSAIASTCGGIIGVVILIFFSINLAKMALSFGPPEYFTLGVFGLTIVSSFLGESWVKGFIAALIGLLLSTVGVDPFTGYPRFTFQSTELFDGVGFIPVLIGLFAISEVFMMFEKTSVQAKGVIIKSKSIFSQLPTMKELSSNAINILRSSIIGTFVGVIPAAGASIASFIAYNEAKRYSKTPEEFGTGSIEGIAAAESANNANCGGALVPMLSLGVPGSDATAVLMSALMLHGLIPGPLLFSQRPDIVYGIFSGLFIASIVMFLIGISGIPLWIKIIKLPKSLLAPIIFGIAFIGSYSINNRMLEVWIMLSFGIIGYFFRKRGFPVVATVIALVLGNMIEGNLCRSLIMSKGSYLIFVTRPISATLLFISVVSFVIPIYRNRKK